MKTFYMIDATGYPVVGIGELVPTGFTEYEVGSEPTDLQTAIASEKSKEDTETAKQITSQARHTSMLSGSKYTLNGVDYMVSFTANDGNGILQVKAAFELGLLSTVIRFDNGTNMPIAASEFTVFAVWFVTERNKFFVGV